MTRAADDRALADRLRRFVMRERHAASAEVREIWRTPLAARVESGDALAPLHYLGTDDEGMLRFALERDVSRFRPGDSLLLGDGESQESSPEILYLDHDPAQGTLRCQPAYRTDRVLLDRILGAGSPLVADRGEFDASDQLHAMITRVFDGHDADGRALSVRDVLAQRVAVSIDDDERRAALLSIEKLAARGIHLDDAQQEAFARAWAARPLHLVQGPPGTGKTWLLALLVAALAWRGERILVTALTHQAVDNAMLALATLARRVGRPLPLARFNARDRHATSRLAALGIRMSSGRRASWPATGGLVVGSTLLSAGTLLDTAPSFTRTVFDEAAQIPVTHALAALAHAPRWTLFGDDRQLGPVLAGDHDGDGASFFEHLRAVVTPTMLTATYRMNDAICGFPSTTFYDGRLRPAPTVGARRFAPEGSSEGVLAEIIDRPAGPVLVIVDHEGHRSVCPPERDAVVDIAHELLARRGVAPHDLAIVAPFRLQNLEIARRLAERLPPGEALPTIDTVERIQGQEREVVILSLTCSDPDALRRDTSFFFSPQRLNVAITRARTRVIIVASERLLDTIPHDYAGLRRLDVFHRLFAELPRVVWPG